jgi:hypothetical protein
MYPGMPVRYGAERIGGVKKTAFPRISPEMADADRLTKKPGLPVDHLGMTEAGLPVLPDPVAGAWDRPHVVMARLVRASSRPGVSKRRHGPASCPGHLSIVRRL